jgi:hypothetical protein
MDIEPYANAGHFLSILFQCMTNNLPHQIIHDSVKITPLVIVRDACADVCLCP